MISLFTKIEIGVNIEVDITQGFAYNGEKLDESGNIYLRARYYNPRIGQFVQINSYRGEQNNSVTQQRYTYCANNQYIFVDPSGHFIGILAGLAIGMKILLGGVVVLGDFALAQTLKNNLIKVTIPKPNPVRTVIEVIAPTTVTALKVVSKIVDTLPEVCPPLTHKSWNDVPNDLLNLAKRLGMMGVLNYLLSKVDITKKPKYEKNNHHIVLHRGQYEIGKYTMEHARKNVVAVYGTINTRENKVTIHTEMHWFLHTHMYKSSIVIKFPEGLSVTEKGKKKVKKI